MFKYEHFSIYNPTFVVCPMLTENEVLTFPKWRHFVIRTQHPCPLEVYCSLLQCQCFAVAGDQGNDARNASMPVSLSAYIWPSSVHCPLFSEGRAASRCQLWLCACVHRGRATQNRVQENRNACTILY